MDRDPSHERSSLVAETYSKPTGIAHYPNETGEGVGTARRAPDRKRGHNLYRCILAGAFMLCMCCPAAAAGFGRGSGLDKSRRAPGPGELTLYEEMDEMNKAAQMSYLIADVRKLSSSGVIPSYPALSKSLVHADSDAESDAGTNSSAESSSSRSEASVMKHGINTGELIEIIDGNFGAIKRELGEFEEGEENSVALEALRAIHARGGGGDAVTLEEFDDKMEDRKLVYCVAKDSFRKRITIMVRGSVPEGTKDWERNFQWGATKVDTPKWMVPLLKRRRKKLSVHQGFYEYLFRNEDIEDTTNRRERIEEIRDNAVLPLLTANKDYKVYITGHSMGGAVATLVAFRAASAVDYKIPLPINLVTFASPYVGCNDFREAFQVLEREGRIRYLRVTNHKDGVSTLFPFTPSLNFYKHVGIHLKLFPKKDKVQIGYPKVGFHPFHELRRGWENSMLYNLGTVASARIAHSTAEFNRRIELQKDLLGGDRPLMLDDLYRNENVVGKLNSTLGSD